MSRTWDNEKTPLILQKRVRITDVSPLYVFSVFTHLWPGYSHLASLQPHNGLSNCMDGAVSYTLFILT